MMLCENIAHGINLRKSPCLQYLYYLAQARGLSGSHHDTLRSPGEGCIFGMRSKQTDRIMSVDVMLLNKASPSELTKFVQPD